MNNIELKNNADITNFLSEKGEMFAENTRLFNNPRLNLDQEIYYMCEILSASKNAARDNQRLLWNIANASPSKIRSTFMKVSQIGLSLNPVLGHLTLVPRGNKICLDIGYKGWIKIGTDNCNLINVEAHVIRKGDEYKNNGFNKEFHFISDELNPDRGTGNEGIIGAFAQCMHSFNGENHYRVCVMGYAELEKCRLSNPMNKYDKEANNNAWKWKDRLYRKYPITRIAKNWQWEDANKQAVIDEVAQEEFIKEKMAYKVAGLSAITNGVESGETTTPQPAEANGRY